MKVVRGTPFSQEKSPSTLVWIMIILVLLSLNTSAVSLLLPQQSDSIQSSSLSSSCFTTPSSFIKSFHLSKSDKIIQSQKYNPLSFHRRQHPSQRGFIHYADKQNNIDENDMNNVSIFGSSNRKQFLQTFFSIIGTGIVSTPFLGEIYSRIGKPHYSSILSNIFQNRQGDVHTTRSTTTPTTSIDDMRNIWSNMEEITFVFHGAGGQDENTDELMKTLSSSSSNNNKAMVQMVDWSSDSSNLLQASVNGMNIGKRIAESLTDILLPDRTGGNNDDDSTRSLHQLRRIHIIGISVGAFAAHSFIQEFNSKFKRQTVSSSSSSNNNNNNHQDNVYIQATFLDPLCSKGVLAFKYGENEFGKGCNYAQQFLNTDDPVPFTNTNLVNCATIDVTNSRPEEIFGHDWPLIYYTKYALPNSTRGFVSIDDQRQIGTVLTL